MVKKTAKKAKKQLKKEKKKAESKGVSVDDAFADDEDIQYAESKPRKLPSEKKGMSEEELDQDLDMVEDAINHIEENSQSSEAPKITASKPISKLKKGDKIIVDGKEMEVDAHYLLMDNGTTKEMALEIFDPKTDKDYQIRYFDDQVEQTLELYELQDIMYFKKPCQKVSW